jgi:2',3'-cyclic-nucleotide 2'-phosphodiesterase (5'-nucleotidase family)
MGMAGGTIFAPDPAQSPVFAVADALTGVDAIVGGHTHTEYVTQRNGMSVTENQNATARFTRVRLVIDKATGGVIYETADFHRPWDVGVTADPAIQAEIDDLNAQLGPIFNTVIGTSNVVVPRSDSCSISTGRIDGRGCESLVGDITADAMRTTYAANFAITNSGGLRADLTCPAVDVAGDNCPAFTPPPYPITRGSVLGVLPFGNFSMTTPLHGDGLKAMLENGVSLMPNASQGRFPQISGLCFTYDVTQNAGSRVTSAVLANPDGTCSATPVDLTAGSPLYTVVQNDFMANGGDGYPNVRNISTPQNIMDQDVGNYIAAHTPLSPVIQGRITCIHGAGPLSANACPAPNP